MMLKTWQKILKMTQKQVSGDEERRVMLRGTSERQEERNHS